MKEIKTERLIIKPFKKSYAKEFFENITSKNECTEYLFFKKHETMQDCKQFLDKVVQEQDVNKKYSFAIFIKESNKLIGEISYGIKKDVGGGVASCGYVIDNNFWNKGHATESLKALIEFVFENTSINRLEANHDVENEKSGMVLRKVGMKYEGTFRGYIKNNKHEKADACIYSILRCEYTNK